MSLHEISIFTPALNKTPSGKITIAEFVTDVKFGKWKKEVEAIRNEPNPDIRKKLKLGVSGVTVSGTFNERKSENLIAHSGFIAIDIDGYSNKNPLLSDPFTYALFSSISNTGLCVIVKINPSKHKESFKWLQNYYYTSYGINIDPAPSNPASLRFVSYDPGCFINEQSEKAKSTSAKSKKPQSLPTILPNDKIGEMIQSLVAQRKNIAEDYVSYRNIGFALASGLGESGRPHFHAISSVSDKYNSAEADRQYNYCLKKPDAGITIGTLFYYLREAGIEFPRDEKYDNAVRVAAIAKKAKRTEAGTAKQLHEINGIDEENATLIAKEVFSRPDITLSAIAADPEKLIESLVAWVSINHPMRKNIITGKLELLGGEEVTTEQMNTIFLQARAGFNTPNITFDLIQRVMFSTFTPQYHPIKDYIESNRHRNTTGNIDSLIDSIKTNTPGADFFIRKWLISLIAAVEGYPVRLVLAFVGPQLSGKTEAFRRLLPDKLKKYYGESKMDAGKDDELLMTQKLIIMDDEMSGKNKTDEKRFKDLTSKHTFSLRAPYDRSNMDYRRLAVLCGTSNDKEIINDPTGNTRILPVEVISINHEAYNAVNKDELFMELVRAYESGENWNFSKDELDKLNTASNKFESIPYERELILEYFEVPGESDVSAEDMTATQIKDYIEMRGKQQIRSLKRLGMELHNIFGERKSIRRGSKVLNVYRVSKLQKNTNDGSFPGSPGPPQLSYAPADYGGKDDDLPF